MTIKGRIMCLATDAIMDMDAAISAAQKGPANGPAPKTKPVASVQPYEDEASDRAILAKMKLASIANFKAQFGANAKVENIVFIE